MMTGVGGQGIQLCAKTLAMAAVEEGRQAMLCGHYAGAIRGGQTDASIVVANGRLRALPILPSAWGGFVMSPKYWEHTRPFIRPGGPVAVNVSLAEEIETDGLERLAIPASDIAEELGSAMGASMILLGAFCAATALVEVDSLVAAMKKLGPSYRQEHVVANEAAIRAGAAAAPSMQANGWAHSPAQDQEVPA
jgi:Pyruvate/2-oxoacid:ferredoxin oxidoreductase gamma subunit